MKYYFAHPVNVYNTPLEQAMITLLYIYGRDNFLDMDIVNPNTPEFQKMYNEAKAASGGTHGQHKGMDVFYEFLKKPEVCGCFSMPFLDCRMGLGVAGETQKTLRLNKSAWIIEPTHELFEEQLMKFISKPKPLNGYFKVRPITEYEKRMLRDHPGELKENPPDFVVGHEETRLRTFLQYGGQMRPYAEAHNVKMPPPPDFYALNPKKK